MPAVYCQPASLFKSFFNFVRINNTELMADGASRDRSRSVVVFAAQSRAFVLLLQFFFNYLIPDHNADVFKPEVSQISSTLDRIISHLFDGLAARWDALYFIHIAEYGYTYENTLVFFPLFPILTKLIAYSLFLPLHYFISFRNVLHFAAISINFFAFLFAAYFFYRLGCVVLKQEHLAYRAAQLFCVNPASIFFSAAYSESLFSLFTFGGLLELQEGRYLKASCFFAFSSATRSNGIINIGFIVYSYILYWHKKSFAELPCDHAITLSKYGSKIISRSFVFLLEVLSLILWVFISCSLFLSHQAFAYLMYCHEMKKEFKKSLPEQLVEYGKLRGYAMPGYEPLPKWCSDRIPFSYSKIQEQHWNIGLFRYYEVNQVPNFLLALPLLLISMKLCISYFNHRPLFCLKLGLATDLARGIETKNNVLRRTIEHPMIYFYQKKCYAYVMQLAFLVAFGTLFMHIQVITRMVCSSCPAFYWYIGERCMTKEERMAMKIASQKHYATGNVQSPEKEIHFVQQNVIEFSHNYNSTSFERSSSEINKSLSNFQYIKGDKQGNILRSRNNSIKSVKDDTLPKENIGNDVIMEVFKESEVIDWSEGLFNKAISIYFHLYLFVGAAAFSNFFPWT